MKRCSFCSGRLPDDYTEDVYQGILACPSCIEKIARDMVERGEEHNVHPDLVRKLKAQGVRRRGG